MKIVFAYKDKLPASYVAFLTELIPPSFTIEHIPFSASDSAFERTLAEADAALFTPSGKYLPSPAFGDRLKLIQLLSSGYEKFNVAGAAAKGIPVANNGGANATAVAEHTILLMLSLLRRLNEHNERGRAGLSMHENYGMDMHTLAGKTVGIIGHGRVGTAVAEKLMCLGARILAYDIQAVPHRTSLPDLLKESDIVTLHVRLNPETAGMFGKNEFATMKKGAFFINTARAELVDQSALIRALSGNKKEPAHLAGAGLDVVQDKRRIDPTFRAHPRVIITPHIAGATRDTYARAMAHAVANFERVAQGEPPLSVINGVSPHHITK